MTLAYRLAIAALGLALVAHATPAFAPYQVVPCDTDSDCEAKNPHLGSF